MEDTSKSQYLRYYQCRSAEGVGKGLKRSGQGKILPHIIEQYNYRITNYLLIKKIISPKRDKTIMSSLQGVQGARKHHSAPKHSAALTRDRQRGKDRFKTFCSLRSKFQERGQSDSQTFVKAVSREGKIAHRCLSKQRSEHLATQISSVMSNEVGERAQKLQDVTHLTNSSKQEFKEQAGGQQRWKEGYPLHGWCFKNHSSGYGHGPTVLLLTQVSLQTNPQIKGQTLIQLQLVQRAAFARSYLDITYSSPEKTIKTEPFKYAELPREGTASIKFCIRALRIGDFVPLRIWKYSGVQSILVGTIDLPLNAYEDGGQNVEIQKKSDDELFRKVFNGEAKQRLLTNKMFESESVAHVKYRVYPKRFRKRE